MTAIFIIAALALLLTLVAFTRLKFILLYEDGLILYAQVLGFKYYLMGKPEKPLNLKHFKIKKFRKRRDKAIKKYKEKLAQKSDKKSSAVKGKNKKKKRFSSPSELTDTIKTLLDGILMRFPKYLHVDIRKFAFEIGGDDAHQTAILYGGAIQSVQYLITALESSTKLKCVDTSKVGVAPNFLEKCFRCKVDITAHIRLFAAMHLGVLFIKNYFKSKSRRKTSVLNERTAK